MKRQDGFTLIELLIVIAIMVIITFVVVTGTRTYFGVDFSGGETSNDESPAYNVTKMEELFSEPISNLGTEELQLLADYCMWSSDQEYSYENRTRWAIRAAVYQNQIIIQQTQGG